MPDHSIEEIAYSYIRFSHPEQSKGDSLRRQTEEAKAWCARKGIRLDESTTLHELGTSAYTGKHRQNPDRHALAAFLRLVEQGRVRQGAYLIIENLDRLSREEEVPACHLMTSILMAGLRIVQLRPAELILTDKSPGWDIMRAVMELSRGHGESAIKSDRVGKAWRQKKRLARETGKPLTRRVPAWVELHQGTLRLIPERAAVVQRIFELSIAGYSLADIVKKFTREGVPSFGSGEVKPGNKKAAHSSAWNRQYIACLLKDRRALGEYQPRHKDGSADGPAVPNYFPAVVSEEVWLAARAGTGQRQSKPGRVSTMINVFAGLLRDATDGGSYYLTYQASRKETRTPILLNLNGVEGLTERRSFPFTPFQEAVLELLAEVDPRELLTGTNEYDKVMQLEGERSELEKAMAALGDDLNTHGESPFIYARLRTKEHRLAEVLEALSKARQEATNPLSASWGEAQGLLPIIDSCPDRDDALLRLRAVLRRIIERIWLLVIPRGCLRIGVVQVVFTGGGTRQYCIIHHSPRGRQAWTSQASWVTRSLASLAPSAFDLSERPAARALKEAVSRIPPETLRLMCP